jgi:hypothetical protein
MLKRRRVRASTKDTTFYVRATVGGPAYIVPFPASLHCETSQLGTLDSEIDL